MQSKLLKVDTAILTRRTVVRRFRENDGPPVLELLQNNISLLEEFHRSTVVGIKSAETAEFFVRKKLALWLTQQEYNFGVWDKESARLIGFIRIFDIDNELPGGNIEFLIDKDFSGQGIMTEALFSTINFAFRQIQLEKLYFTTLMDDYTGQRLVRKCGFRREGDLRGAFRKQAGDIIDLMLLGITKAEFEKV